MDERSVGPMTDATLAREIEQALAVDPSPAFAPAVRARVSMTGQHWGWWGSWRLVSAAGTLAALSLMAGLWASSGSRAPVAVPSAPAPATIAAPILASPVRFTAQSASTPGVVTSRAALMQADPDQAAGRTGFEPLVAPDDLATLQRLLQQLRDPEFAQVFSATTLGRAADREGIIVEPIDVAPLAMSANAEANQQGGVE